MTTVDELTEFLWDHVIHGTLGITEEDGGGHILYLTTDGASIQLGKEPTKVHPS